MDDEQIYNNRALLKDCTDYECCDEELVFAMKDNYHEFSLGLSTVLECVAMAEKEGYLPKFPEGWWVSIRHY